MLPNKKIGRHPLHKYHSNNIDVLKVSALYGANASGKTNLIDAVDVLKKIVTSSRIPEHFLKSVYFKLDRDSADLPTKFVIEFMQEEFCFLYAVQIKSGKIQAEELYRKYSDNYKSVFIREKIDNEINIQFSDGILSNEEDKSLTGFIKSELIDDTKTILYVVANLKNGAFSDIRGAYTWFKKSLIIIHPNTKPVALVQLLDSSPEFKIFAENLMRSSDTGVINLITKSISIEQLISESGNDNEKDKNELLDKLSQELDSKSGDDEILTMRTQDGEEFIIYKENEQILAKKLLLEHSGYNGSNEFNLEIESDGTKRVLDLIPAFSQLVNSKKTIFIDEIERSLHTTLIKTLVSKFVEMDASKGQLIFTTHDTNLLDQNILRTDEIWFVRKDKFGSSSLLPLNDFKEHATKDIQKGYLNGRYKAVPELDDLIDLNWEEK